MSSEILAWSATQLAAAIREKQVSAREATEAYLVHNHNQAKAVNAVIYLDEEGALKRAEEADQTLELGNETGPLHGVPMTLKDVWDTKGMRTTIGLPQLGGNIPENDAVVVAQLKQAGANVMGKSNLPFMSYDWQCKHPIDGRANNPWALERTTGGSSGGAAAAVAAGMTPLEIGSDIAGSIRVPSHYCGVFGLRPTEGSVDGTGSMNVPPPKNQHFHLVTGGPIARCVEDLRLGLRVILNPKGPTQEQSATKESRSKRPRVAFTREFPGYPVCKATHKVMDTALRSLEKAGWQLEEVSVAKLDLDDAFRIWGAIHGHEFVMASPAFLRSSLVKKGIIRHLPAFFFGKGAYSRWVSEGLMTSALGYQRALQDRIVLQQRYQQFLSNYDAWLTPTSCTVAFPHSPIGGDLQLDGQPIPYSSANDMYNCPTAAIGHPIVVVPCGLSADGLPVGLQLHGHHGQDFRLLDWAENMAQAVDFTKLSPRMQMGLTSH
jgi:amidase